MFTRNITTPVSSFELFADVPVGTYLVSYSASVRAEPATLVEWLDCYVTQVNGSVKQYVAESYTEGSNVAAAVSGAGLVTKTVSTGTISLYCVAHNPFINYDGEPGTEPVQFVLTPENAAVSTSARYAPNARTAR